MKTLIVVLAITMPAAAQQSYSPYVDRNYPENVYWGDTHVHTYLSADAYGLGTRITPDQAYRNGVLPAVGSTVDLSDASYQNTIGSPELSTTWSDPDFNETERAVYYVRVLQIPTPRWTVYDAKFYQQELPQDSPLVIEERAYSSPVWYTPGDS